MVQGRRFPARAFSPDDLWRLSEGSQEGAAHAVAIGKTGFAGQTTSIG